MSEPIAPNNSHRGSGLPRRGKIALIGAGLLALGGAAGAVVMAETRPSISMAPVKTTAIGSLSSTDIVTIRGQVAEIYGNKFVMADRSGRALVDLGREGDDRQLVKAGQQITVQGRFDRGFIHAAFLVGPDNKVLALGPLAGPSHGPGRHGPDGPPSPPGDDRTGDAPARPGPVASDGVAPTVAAAK